MSVTVEEARRDLPELLEKLLAGESFIVTRPDGVGVLLSGSTAEPRKFPSGERPLGTMKGKLRIISDDDDHLEDFREYMPSDDELVPPPAGAGE